MATEKTAIDHVNDFFEGIYDTAVGAPIALGDFLARVSGYRDYQFNSGSVLDLDSNMEQKQALNEMNILYEAIKNETSRNLIIGSLIEDFQERPAYYLGGIGTTETIARTFTNEGVKYAYKALITGSKVEQKVNELYNTTEDFLNLNNDDFHSFINNNLSDTPWLDTSNESYINMAKELGVNQVTQANQTYTIQNGDTLWDLSKRLGITIDELIEKNLWLKDRISQDGKYALIKVGEEIKIPEKDENDEQIPPKEINREVIIDPRGGLTTKITYEYNVGNKKITTTQYVTDTIIRHDPLALDLNHDRVINTTNLSDGEAYFDLNDNGSSEKTSWISDGDGWLVYDENENGRIDNGNELFGTQLEEGYSVLRRKFDSNGDNVINKDDENFDKLQVWIDDGDGLQEDGELKTLDELNITDVKLCKVYK